MGGDHSGSSFKIAVQVLNMCAPNAKENTISTGCFEGGDTDKNLDKNPQLLERVPVGCAH